MTPHRRRFACRFLLLAGISALVTLVAPATVRAEYANPHGVAVIIGNKAYRNERVPDVAYAHRDAEAFRRFVLDVLGFDPENVIDLRDATQAELEAAFGNERSHEGRVWRYLHPRHGSDVVVYYSGHGVPGLEGKRGYLLPSDADPDAPEINGYPIDLLYANLGKLAEAKSVRLYLDADFSGGSDQGASLPAESGEKLTALSQGSGSGPKLTVLSAASSTEVASWDHEAGHGLFTFHLLNALYGAGDLDANGRVTALEAKTYLDDTMTIAALRAYGRQQHANLAGNAGAVLSQTGSGGAFPPRPGVDGIRVASNPRAHEGDRADPAEGAGEVTPPPVETVDAEEKALDLTHAERVLVQHGLASLGEDVGVADGVFGRRTRAGIERYQRKKGLAETGYLTDELRDALIASGKAREAEEGRRAEAAAREAERERQAAALRSEKEREEGAREAEAALRVEEEHRSSERPLSDARVDYANPDGVAVIIGNRTYGGDIPAVDFAHRDAEAFRRYVLDVLGFDPENIIDLRDTTQAEMWSTFGSRTTADRSELWSYLADEGSDVVVFYSGHGVPGIDDERGYLLPVNADPNTAELNGYPIDVLFKNLANLKLARSIAVYLDACFSGGSGGGGMLIEGASPVYVEASLPDTGTERLTVLTAASDKQLASWDRTARHGLFTHHLLEALYGKADRDVDGRVTAREAKAYLDRYMTRAAKRTWKRRQRAGLMGNADAVLAKAGAGAAFPPRPTLESGRTVPREAGEEAAVAAEAALGLTFEQRVQVQHGLASLGEDIGLADGVFGRRTRNALRSYQKGKGLSETGHLTAELRDALVALGKSWQTQANRQKESGRERARVEGSTGESSTVLFSDDFSRGTLEKWTTEVESGGRRWKNCQRSPIPCTLAVENGALELVGTDSGNYTVMVVKDIFPADGFTRYELSFDWKSTVKETPYGVSYISARFFDKESRKIADMLALNTGFVGRPFSDHGGSLGPGLYGGVFKAHESFDWERVTLDTATAVPRLNVGDVHRILLRALVYNDAGRGGDLYVDDLTLRALKE